MRELAAEHRPSAAAGEVIYAVSPGGPGSSSGPSSVHHRIASDSGDSPTQLVYNEEIILTRSNFST